MQPGRPLDNSATDGTRRREAEESAEIASEFVTSDYARKPSSARGGGLDFVTPEPGCFNGLITGETLIPFPGSGSTAASAEVRNAWKRSAARLAEWTLHHLVNRTDAYGSYISKEMRRQGQSNAFTVKSTLTSEILQRHYRGAATKDLIGLHSTICDDANGPGEVAASWSRWLAIDIDNHDNKVDATTTTTASTALHDRVKALGFNPLLLDSSGAGGYHLLVVFSEPSPTHRVYAFGRSLVRDWKSLGLDREPETFPKQAALRGRFGNWLRLPGRHHARDHFHRVWDSSTSRWMEGHYAIEAILNTTGTTADLIPAESLLSLNTPKGKAKSSTCDLRRDSRLAEQALGHLDPSMEYDSWLKVGMALTSGLGREGLILWENWSSKSDKYREGICDEKYRSFNGSGTNLGTLFQMAKERGYILPRGPGRPPTVGPPRGEATVTTNPGEASPVILPIASDIPKEFANYHTENHDESGKS